LQTGEADYPFDIMIYLLELGISKGPSLRSLSDKKDKKNGIKSYRNPAGHPIVFADKAF